MLMVAQFPLSDARPFAPDRAWRLPVPDWPRPRTFNSAQFVRHFGSAVERRGRLAGAWADEGAFCTAHRAVALPDLGRHRLPDQPAGVVPVCAFRRLFVDASNVVCRVEVGIATRHPLAANTSADNLVEIAHSMLHVDARVPDSATSAATGPLVAQGRRLARLYEFATTTRRNWGSRKQDLVEDGTPLLVMEMADGEPYSVPAQATHVDPNEIGGARAAFLWLKVAPGKVPVWLLGRGDATATHLRSLRLCLLRLHAEQQALDLVLKQLQRRTITYVPDDDPGSISEYLNEATRRIGRAGWGGISQEAIRDAAYAAESVNYNDAVGLGDRLEGARRQVAAKTEAYWRERTAPRTTQVFQTQGGNVTVTNEQFNFSGTFHGTVVGKVSAQSIDNSFNTTVATSDAAPELKDALKELHEQVKGLLSDVGALEGEAPGPGPSEPAAPGPSTAREPSDDATAPTAPGDEAGGVLDADLVREYLETLTKQAVSSKPVKGFIEVAAKGLVDAAKLVVSRAGPIVTAVSTVLKLVGVPVPF